VLVLAVLVDDPLDLRLDIAAVGVRFGLDHHRHQCTAGFDRGQGSSQARADFTDCRTAM
jgi:hypothetical protein